VTLALPVLRILVFAPEPAAEKGWGHALPLVVAPRVIDVLPCGVRLAQQVEQGVMLVVLHDAYEGVTHRQVQDRGCLLCGMLSIRSCLIRQRFLVGAGGAVSTTGWKGDHIVWGFALFTFTFT
jgi:hypothetical protein